MQQLSEVLDRLKPLCAPTDEAKATMGGSRLLMELASSSDASAAFSSAQATPLLHAMGAAHGYVLMFVHVCRTGQTEIRSLSLQHWGKKEGARVLKGMSCKILLKTVDYISFYRTGRTLHSSSMGKHSSASLLQ